LTRDNFTEYVDCSNPPCAGGGVKVGVLLHQMVATGQSDAEFYEACIGEDPRKGWCTTTFAITAHVDYRT
jgi:hypothetical protein